MKEEKKEEKKFIMMIAPSYKCNAACEYCYARNFEKVFKKDMSLFEFSDIIDNHKKAGGNAVSIIGGEPSIWKPINKAIMYCKMKGMEVKIFTNGIIPVKVMPSLVYLNINHYFESAKRKFVKKTLDYYKKKKVKVILRYNMLENEAKDVLNKKINILIDLVKKNEYSKEIHFALAIPYVINKKNGELIHFAMKKVIDSGIYCYSANSIPPCMFHPDQLEYLRKKAGFHSTCYIGMQPLINPDGKTVQPCVKWQIYKDAKEIRHSARFKDVAGIFEKYVKEAQKKAPLRCQKCSYFQKKQCNVMCWTQAGKALFED